MSRVHRVQPDEALLRTQEDELMENYGCECCALAGVQVGTCYADNIPDTRGYCNGWVLNVDWAPQRQEAKKHG